MRRGSPRPDSRTRPCRREHRLHPAGRQPRRPRPDLIRLNAAALREGLSLAGYMTRVFANVRWKLSVNDRDLKRAGRDGVAEYLQEKARDAILKDFKKVDVLVNNAGIYPHATLKEITVEGWNKMFDVNALSVLLTTRTFMEPMVAQNYGRVVNIITKRSVKGVMGRAEAGISQRGYNANQRVSLTAGTGDLDEQGYNAYVSGFYYT